MANATAQAYIDYVLDRKLAISQMAVKFLSRRIEEQRRKLQAIPNGLAKIYGRKPPGHGYPPTTTTTSSRKNWRTLTSNWWKPRLTAKEAASQLSTKRLKARKGQSKFEGIKAFMESPVIQKVRERELELSKREAELSQKYGARHPQDDSFQG